jgi:hypothetical protein
MPRRSEGFAVVGRVLEKWKEYARTVALRREHKTKTNMILKERGKARIERDVSVCKRRPGVKA